MHARRTILCDHKGNVWTKLNSKKQFDVSMRAKDGAEICELVGLYILTEVHKNIDFTSVGLCRDDGLAVMLSASGSSLDRYRKKTHHPSSRQRTENNCYYRKNFNKLLRHKLQPKFRIIPISWEAKRWTTLHKPQLESSNYNTIQVATNHQQENILAVI